MTPCFAMLFMYKVPMSDHDRPLPSRTIRARYRQPQKSETRERVGLIEGRESEVIESLVCEEGKAAGDTAGSVA